MLQENLPPLRLQLDFSQSAGDGSGPLWVEKMALHQVRLRKPEDQLESGEPYKEGQVVILPTTRNKDAKPLYAMNLDEFLEASQPWKNGRREVTDEPTMWFVEKKPRRAILVPESHGPFHLNAPEKWEGHPGWDVRDVSKVSGVGREFTGYLIVETPDGPAYDLRC